MKSFDWVHDLARAVTTARTYRSGTLCDRLKIETRAEVLARWRCRLANIREMHIAQGRGETACDEIRYRGVELLVLRGIAGAWRECLIDQPTRARQPHRLRIVQRRGSS